MIGCTLAGLTLEKTACYSSVGSSRETRENCAKSGTGEVGKEVLSFDLEVDRDGRDKQDVRDGRGSKFRTLQPSVFSLETASPVPLFSQVSRVTRSGLRKSPAVVAR